MEQRLSEWPKLKTTNSSQQQQQSSGSVGQKSTKELLKNSNSVTCINNINKSSNQQKSNIGSGNFGLHTDAEKTITQLESQIEEQKQLRLQDARQVEVKAAKIKEWVTNKLRELEEQNQLLREQNVKCNQQLELLRNHISTTQANYIRHSSVQPSVRSSLSLDVQDFDRSRVGHCISNTDNIGKQSTISSRRRSESLEPSEYCSEFSKTNHSGITSVIGHPILNYPVANSSTNSSLVVSSSKSKVSMEPQDLARDLAAAVDSLNLIPLGNVDDNNTIRENEIGGAGDTIHDYAEIYTPSREKAPAWLKAGSNIIGVGVGNLQSGGSSTTTTATNTSESALEGTGIPRPPTPPLHRFPSWEAKIYQVANDGLAGEDGDSQDPDSSSAVLQQSSGPALQTVVATRSQATVSDGYCDISVPVYATVKGRASQIRSMPFTGDSSDDDSSEGEDHAVIMTTTCTTSTHNSHNSSSTDNTETSTESGSASSPSKSLKTSSSLSPAKRSGSESPKTHTKPRGEDLIFLK